MDRPFISCCRPWLPKLHRVFARLVAPRGVGLSRVHRAGLRRPWSRTPPIFVHSSSADCLADRLPGLFVQNADVGGRKPWAAAPTLSASSASDVKPGPRDSHLIQQHARLLDLSGGSFWLDFRQWSGARYPALLAGRASAQPGCCSQSRSRSHIFLLRDWPLRC